MKDQTSNPDERRERDFRRLGTRNPSCTSCGETDSRCLERHHIAGCKYHDDTVIQCRNCHRKLSDSQLDHPSPPPTGPDQQFVVIGRFLLGLADWFALVVERLREFGAWLIDLANGDNEASA